MEDPTEITTPTECLSTIDEEEYKEIENTKRTPEQIKARNEAFMKFWNDIQHLRHDPDFERLPIPYNFQVILDMIYKQISEEEGMSQLTGPDIEKYIETKEELKEKEQGFQEREEEDKKKKKRRNRKRY
jgi:hypothetical protein